MKQYMKGFICLFCIKPAKKATIIADVCLLVIGIDDCED